MPRRRFAFIVLLALAPAALAQPWPTTSWELFCGSVDRWSVDGAGVIEPASPDWSPCSGPDGALAAATREELHAASEWLEGLGFRPPMLRRGTGTEAGYLATLAAPEVYSQSTPVDGYFYFYRDLDVGDLVLARRPVPGKSPASHELFHAVQAAYPFWAARRADPADHGWVFEGTAQAVEVARLRAAGSRSSASAGRHNYSLPLDRPEDGSGYTDWHFWTALGEVLTPGGDLAYLGDLLASDAWGTERSLAVIDRELRTYHPGGLFHLLPEVAARSLGDDYAEAYGMDGEVAVIEPADVRKSVAAGSLPPVAIHAHAVVVHPLGEPHEIRIQIPDRPGLHLIVDGQRRDEGLGVRNEYRGTVSGSDTTQYRVLVVNVAPDAATTTEETYDLTVEATPIEACGAPYGAFASVTDTGAADANGRFEVVFEPTTVETAGVRYDTYFGLTGIRRASNRSYTWSEASAREAREGIERSQRMIRELGWEDKTPTEIRRAMATLDPATLARFFPEDDDDGAATLADALGAGFTATITEADGDGTTALSFFNAEEDFNVAIQIFFSPQRGPGTYTAQTMVGVQAPFMRPGGAASAEGTQLYEPTVTFSTLDPEGCAIGTFSGSYLGPDNQPGTITGSFRVVVPPDATVADIR